MKSPFFIALQAIGMYLLGLPVVAIALLFRVEHYDTAKPFTQHPENGNWALVTLPDWALQWSNPADGALGDQRGWWDAECRKKGRTCRSFLSMWIWLARRNDADYWSRITMGVDQSRCKVERLDGAEQIDNGSFVQRLLATRDDGETFPLFEGQINYANGTHCCEWRFGWKVGCDDVTPDMPIAERYRGSVFRLRPWKAI